MREIGSSYVRSPWEFGEKRVNGFSMERRNQLFKLTFQAPERGCLQGEIRIVSAWNVQKLDQICILLVTLAWSCGIMFVSITISRSVYKPKGEEQLIKSTKSISSNRTVYIPESCADVLYELKIEQAKDKRNAQGLWEDSGFVFTDKYGKNISIYAPTRICSEVQERHGLRHLKLHGLRHTCGSLKKWQNKQKTNQNLTIWSVFLWDLYNPLV